jgi:hypothetical protein
MWLLTVLMLAAMFFVPLYEWSIACLPFASFGVWALLTGLVERKLRLKGRIGFAIIWFLYLCFVHTGFVLTGTLMPLDYIRGLVPFLFMGVAFLASASVRRETDLMRYYFGLIAVAALFASEQLSVLPAMMTGQIWRSTQATTYFSVPFPLVGFHLSMALLVLSRRKLTFKAKGGLALFAGAMLIAELITGTRSLLLGCAIPLVFLMPGLKKAAAVLLVGSLLTLGGLMLGNRILQNALRFDDTMAATHGDFRDTNLATRASENTAAIELFSQSPILGHGIGSKLLDPTNTGTPVAYIHNSPLYLLVDFGLFGMLYWAPIVVALRTCWRLRNSPWRSEVTGLGMAILGILIFAQGFVAVRGMHSTAALFSLVGAVEAIGSYRKTRRLYNTPSHLPFRPLAGLRNRALA